MRGFGVGELRCGELRCGGAAVWGGLVCGCCNVGAWYCGEDAMYGVKVRQIVNKNVQVGYSKFPITRHRGHENNF